MSCNNSENCSFYRTYRFKTDSRQYQFLTKTYCEGNFQQYCRRKQYEIEYCKEPPEKLAPNGYLVNTHKKINIKNTRKHERHKVNNCVCLLQIDDTERTFSAKLVDISEGGAKIELNADLEDLKTSIKTCEIKILGYTSETLPIPLTKDTLKMAWQSNHVFGCSFVDANIQSL